MPLPCGTHLKLYFFQLDLFSVWLCLISLICYKPFGKPHSEGERVSDPLTTIFGGEDSGTTLASIKT